MVNYDLVPDLHQWRQTWKIGVKVLKTWDAWSVHSGNFMKVLLGDQNGDKIEAKVTSGFIDKFKSLLVENHWVRIHYFLVVPQTSNPFPIERNTMSEWEIVVTSDTLISEINELTNHPMVRITPFLHIIFNQVSSGQPLDICGRIYDVRPLVGTQNSHNEDSSGTPFGLIRFMMKDIQGYILHCVAFGKLAYSFSHAWDSYNGTLVVGVLSGWNAIINEKSIQDDNGEGTSSDPLGTNI